MHFCSTCFASLYTLLKTATHTRGRKKVAKSITSPVPKMHLFDNARIFFRSMKAKSVISISPVGPTVCLNTDTYCAKL